MASLDLIGAMGLTAGAAIIASTLVPAGFADLRARFLAGGLLAIWYVLLIASVAAAAPDPRVGLGVPALGLAVVAPIVATLLLVAFLPQLRVAVRAIPLPLMIAVNVVRVLGVLFVLLYLSYRLPGPFALTAGYGDIAIGATAPFVAWLAARGADGWRGVTWLWSSLGLLDLFTALGLGVVSSEGTPVQLIFSSPNTSAMTELPWILIPAFLVPLLMLIHFAIIDRLLWTRSRSLSSNLDKWASGLSA
jgi:hypothetical protein